jgi:two-component system, OmpR family, phosphate regulon response regulator PhoB
MRKILVVDDDEDILKVISFVLKDEGYTVVTSTTGDVISKLDTIKPNLILLDCCLEEGYGDDLCREIKSNPLYKHIPVIIISAVRNLDFIARKCKANGYIEKPFDNDQLVAVVGQHFLHHQHQ